MDTALCQPESSCIHLVIKRWYKVVALNRCSNIVATTLVQGWYTVGTTMAVYSSFYLKVTFKTIATR